MEGGSEEVGARERDGGKKEGEVEWERKREWGLEKRGCGPHTVGDWAAAARHSPTLQGPQALPLISHRFNIHSRHTRSARAEVPSTFP